jgi:ribokinase
MVGHDPEGSYLIEDLTKEGVDTAGVLRAKKLRTGQVYVALDKEGKRMMFAFSGAANTLGKKDIDSNYISSAKFIHIADLKNLSPLEAAAKAARNAETKVCLNPGALIAVQGYEEIKALLSNTDVFISSVGELNQIFDTENVEFSLRKLFKSGPEIAAITLGHQGCIVADSKGASHRIPAFTTTVVDTTGAGDAFCAGLLASLIRGASLMEAAKFANAVAALKVAKLGARALPTKGEVEDFLLKQKE